ncbi:probable disease resistance protein At5g43730 [Physcomitrium patens]|uniref:probable disease resistance protein At5g43730 n=1 Tax=Physcomitrium patens TaxID=3218 RepID=UPI003CCE0684
MEIAMVTSTTLTNVNYNCNLRAKELAFDKIKKCVDNVVHGKRGSDAPQRQQIVLQAVFGLDDITTRLKALVLEGQEMGPRAVGIWGKGGAGKRLLAQRIHNDRQVQQHYKTSIIWLTIGRDASINALYESMSNTLQASLWMSSSPEVSRTTLYNELLRRKVLILDDL